MGIGDFSAVVAGDTTGPDSGVTPQPDLAGRAFAPRTMWRQANSLSRLAIAASRLAWEDAALALRRNELENVGVMYATESGSRESVGDYGSRELLEDILESEEEHIDWLETQLGLIDKVGLENDLQSQMDD